MMAVVMLMCVPAYFQNVLRCHLGRRLGEGNNNKSTSSCSSIRGRPSNGKNDSRRSTAICSRFEDALVMDKRTVTSISSEVQRSSKYW